MKFEKRYFFCIPSLLGGISVFLIDQLTKMWAETTLKNQESFPIFKKILSFDLLHNTGAAFGILSSENLILTILGVVASVLVVFTGMTSVNNRLRAYSMALLLGGVLGNLVDRIRLGHVVDFIALSFWPTFNLADIALVVGCLMLVIDILRKDS